MSDSHTDLMSGEPSLPLSRAAEDALPKRTLAESEAVESLNLGLTSGGVTDSSRRKKTQKSGVQKIDSAYDGADALRFLANQFVDSIIAQLMRSSRNQSQSKATSH